MTDVNKITDVLDKSVSNVGVLVEEVTIIDLHRAMQSRATTVYDPVYRLVSDGKRYVSQVTAEPTTIPEPALRFSLVFAVELGHEDALLRRMRRRRNAACHRRTSTIMPLQRVMGAGCA